MTGSDRNEGEWPATLRDLLAGQARVRLATPEDNDQILAFFQHMTMKVRGLALRYDRSPNYFAHLQHQGRRQVVVLFFYADGALGGVAALGLNPVFVAGQVQWAGYFSDLRIGPALGRILGRHWAEFFAQCLRHLQTLAEPDACRFLYFAVLDQNQGALRSIARNRTPMTARALIKYESVNLLARVPLLWRVGLGRAARQFQVRQATLEDLPRLRVFLERQNRDHLFGGAFSHEGGDELDRRLAQWEGLRLEGFILAEARDTGQLVGCLNPWAPRSSRRLVVAELPWFLRRVGDVLPLFGKKRIREGDALDTLYLSHLEVATGLAPAHRRGILALMLAHLFNQGLDRQAHLVTFFDYPGPAALAQGLHGYLAQRTPATLYQAIAREDLETGLDLARLPAGTVPAFEPGLA